VIAFVGQRQALSPGVSDMFWEGPCRGRKEVDARGWLHPQELFYVLFNHHFDLNTTERNTYETHDT